MASIYDIKPKFQALLRPITRLLAGIGVTANMVTVAALIISIAVGVIIAMFPDRPHLLLIVPPWMFLRMALNAIDGMLAREHDMKSNLGAVLNELGDVIADAVIYLAFGLVKGINLYWVIAVVFISVLTEFAGVVAIQIGASRRYEGPMGKSDRAFCFGALALIIGCGVKPGAWLDWVWGVMVVLLVITVLNRAAKALREVETEKAAEGMA